MDRKLCVLVFLIAILIMDLSMNFANILSFNANIDSEIKAYGACPKGDGFYHMKSKKLTFVFVNGVRRWWGRATYQCIKCTKRYFQNFPIIEVEL